MCMIFKHVVAQALICSFCHLGSLRVQSQTSEISLFAASFINFTVPNHLLCLFLRSQLQLVSSKPWDGTTLQSDNYTHFSKEPCWLHRQGSSILTVDAAYLCKMTTRIYQTARSHLPEDGLTVNTTEMRVCNVTQFIRDS
jgi:hypothetical protein